MKKLCFHGHYLNRRAPETQRHTMNLAKVQQQLSVSMVPRPPERPSNIQATARPP